MCNEGKRFYVLSRILWFAVNEPYMSLFYLKRIQLLFHVWCDNNILKNQKYQIYVYMYSACGEDIFIFGKYTISFCVKKYSLSPMAREKHFYYVTIIFCLCCIRVCKFLRIIWFGQKMVHIGNNFFLSFFSLVSYRHVIDVAYLIRPEYYVQICFIVIIFFFIL